MRFPITIEIDAFTYQRVLFQILPPQSILKKEISVSLTFVLDT